MGRGGDRLHPHATHIMQKYIGKLKHKFPNELIGVYVHGSLALDEYRPDVSDIDFVTVIREPFTREQIDQLGPLHHPEMEGIYVRADDVGKTRSSVVYVNGKQPAMIRGVPPVTWWLLEKKGIRLYGPPYDVFQSRTTDEQLVHYVKENMNTYWRHHPAPVTEEDVYWCLSGVLRQWYTLEHRDIISKRAALVFGHEKLPTEWHDLLGVEPTSKPIKDKEHAHRCMLYIIEQAL
ncbi:nucleotidyltransferase domain-containing protein [Geomicrobium sp. JSM 1781026]|uniref:nucleotidyltransferase domain-containing protein n=1 Tax=Geomicrobium sp. JSM 1781026 TaxID=3344580 RepID=UPI0035BFABDD